MENLASIIKDIGFPASMAVALLFILEIRLKTLHKDLEQIKLKLEKCVTMSSLLVKDKLGGE